MLPDTERLALRGNWAVGKDEDHLYYLEINEYAVRRLTDDARKMMTIDIQQYDR